MKRRGATLLECAVWALIAVLVLNMLRGVLVGGVKTSVRTMGHDDAIRTAQLASERIANDLRRALLTTGAGIEIPGAATLRIPVVAMHDSTSYKGTKTTVVYALEALPGETGLYRLTRREGSGPAQALRGCVLTGLSFRFVDPASDFGKPSPWRRFVQMTLTVPFAKGQSTPFTVLVPVTVQAAPPAFPLPAEQVKT